MTTPVFFKLLYLATLPLNLLTGFFALKVTLHFLDSHPSKLAYAALYIIHTLAAVMIVFVGVGDYFTPVVTGILFICSVLVCCRGSLTARFSIGIIIFMLPLSFNAVLTSLRPPFDRYIFVFMCLFWGAIFAFVRRALPEGEKPPIRSARLWGLIDLLALMPFGSVFALIAFTSPEYLGILPDRFLDTLYIPHERVLIFILCLAVVEALGLFVTVVVLSRHERLVRSEHMWELREAHYLNIEEASLLVRRMRHDMANHLTALAGLEPDAAKDYLGKLIDSPAMTGGRSYCENETANTVLSAKIPAMLEAGIRIEPNVTLPEKTPLSDIDLCSLLANCLDNAARAVRALPPDLREIQIDCALDKGFFVLKISNPTAEPLKIEEGRIASTKKDRDNHGLGLAGMRDIARRHGGVFDIRVENSRFTLLVMIPENS